MNETIENNLQAIEPLLKYFSSILQFKRVSFAEARGEYENMLKNLRSNAYRRSVCSTLNKLESFVGHKKLLIDITPRDAELFIINIQRKSPRGFAVDFRNLKTFFNKQKVWGYIFSNPFNQIKLTIPQRLKPKILEDEDLIKVVSFVKSVAVKDLIRVAFHTGCRLSELTNLLWTDVVFKEGFIQIGSESFVTKNRRQRTIPMNNVVFEILEKKASAKKKNENFVFSKASGLAFTPDHISKKFKYAARKACLDEAIHFHSLRHSFATHLARKGVSLHIIKELLGHTSIRTTEIYSQQNFDSMKVAVDLLNNLSK
jgi:integrase/recombinase XerD